MSEEEKKMTPLNEKKQKGAGIEWFFAGEVKEAVRSLIKVVEWKCGKQTDNSLFWNDNIKEIFGAGLTDE